ncbi:MAG: hypothetical protein P4L36_08360 [Holophaga sp.]|nr:hypothetical protein [Holophaga sp.]
MANSIRWLGTSLVLALLCAVPASAQQQGRWDHTRPQRAQVNKRPANQLKRADPAVKSGTLQMQEEARQRQQDAQQATQPTAKPNAQPTAKPTPERKPAPQPQVKR